MMLLFLFATGLFAGTVDAIAGGGGLITLPVLLSLGIPPHLAFGTNKLQACFGTLIAAKRYHRQGWIALEKAYVGIIFGLLGAVTGAVGAQLLSAEILHKIIPILLAVILVYSFVSPKLGTTDESPRMSERCFYILFGFGLGFYDGFFGPGVGSFWVFCLTFFMGYNLVKATAYTKVFNLNSSLVALVCFMIGGNVDYHIALVMAAGQLLGGRLGAHLAIKNGVHLIRPIFLMVVASTTVTLLYKSYSSSEAAIHLVHAHEHLLQSLIGTSLLMMAFLLYRYRLQKIRE